MVHDVTSSVTYVLAFLYWPFVKEQLLIGSHFILFIFLLSLRFYVCISDDRLNRYTYEWSHYLAVHSCLSITTHTISLWLAVLMSAIRYAVTSLSWFIILFNLINCWSPRIETWSLVGTNKTTFNNNWMHH